MGKMPAFVQNLTGITLDIAIVGVFVVSLLIFGLYFGKYRIMSLLLALYIAIPLYLYFPYKNALDTVSQGVFSQWILFLILVALLFFILQRIISTGFGFSGTRKAIELALLSAAIIVVVFAIYYRIIPSESIHDFTKPFDVLFDSQVALFYWLALPILAVFFSARNNFI